MRRAHAFVRKLLTYFESRGRYNDIVILVILHGSVCAQNVHFIDNVVVNSGMVNVACVINVVGHGLDSTHSHTHAIRAKYSNITRNALNTFYHKFRFPLLPSPLLRYVFVSIQFVLIQLSRSLACSNGISFLHLTNRTRFISQRRLTSIYTHKRTHSRKRRTTQPAAATITSNQLKLELGKWKWGPHGCRWAFLNQSERRVTHVTVPVTALLLVPTAGGCFIPLFWAHFYSIHCRNENEPAGCVRFSIYNFNLSICLGRARQMWAFDLAVRTLPTEWQKTRCDFFMNSTFFLTSFLSFIERFTTDDDWCESDARTDCQLVLSINYSIQLRRWCMIFFFWSVNFYDCFNWACFSQYWTIFMRR